MQNEMNYEHIPQEEFAFAQMEEKLHDKKLETKARSFFADALIRFRKNKSSVIAAYIIGFLILFAVFSPMLSPYTIKDTEKVYVNYPPFVESVSDLGIGILDGAVKRTSQSQAQLDKWHAIGQETGMDPVIRVLGTTETKVKWKNDYRVTTYYKIENNRYYETGIVYRTLSYEEFEKICAWQDETGLQVIYPYVESKDILGIKDNPNLWYQISDE